jgi:nicotinate dehydrogenase subunit B
MRCRPTNCRGRRSETISCSMHRCEMVLSERWELTATFSRSNLSWTNSPTSPVATPLAFRLAHLRDPRARAVLQAAADPAGWIPGEKGDGRNGRGLAFCRYKNIGMYAAVVVDVEVDRKTGVIKVPRVVLAADVGPVVNPDGAKNQLEGGVVQAVSLTLKEQVAFDQREITSRDWSGYPILTFGEVPSIEISLMDRSDPSLGAGEGSLPPTSAALANAFAHATGRRLRELPMTPERVKASLS